MKIKMEGRISIQIHLFLSLVIARFISNYPIAKHRGNNKTTRNNRQYQPCYLQISRRLNKIDIYNSVSNRSRMDEDDRNIIIAISSMGIKVTNRG